MPFEIPGDRKSKFISHDAWVARRAAVHEALDNSLINGFDPRNARDAEYLAEDLCELDADLEGVDPKAITHFVQEWLVDHR